MPELSWSQALVLEVPAMDEVHQQFVDLLAAVSDAGDGELLQAWATLVGHTDEHFAQEDRWMRETGFASGNCHSTQHRVVLAALRDGLALARTAGPGVIRHLARELAVWFPQHAQHMDAALALHLRGVGFDLATGEVRRPERMPREAISGCGSVGCSTPATPAVSAADAR
jgi:hemerythrin-like metal-binding protein